MDQATAMSQVRLIEGVHRGLSTAHNALGVEFREKKDMTSKRSLERIGLLSHL